MRVGRQIISMNSLHQQKNTLRKKILLFSLFFVFLFPLFGTVHYGFAQSMESETAGADVSDEITTSNAAATAAGDAAVSADSSVASVGNTTAKPKDGSSEVSFWTSPLKYLGQAILNVAAAFTWAGGKLLDLSISYFVFGMGDLLNQSRTGGAIDDVWKIIRDIANLAFIFAFIFLGIRTIIEPDSHSVKQTLSRIIIGALLINFSLFIVKFVVDFANLTAYHIYTALVSGSGSLSGKVADTLGVVTLYNFKDPTALAKVFSTGETSFWYYILAAVFLFITAFVFIVAAIHLVMRFITLILIMIASPVLFAANLFPKTSKMASEIWGKLFANALYAPAFLFMILISITILEKLGTSIVPGQFNLANGLANLKTGGNTDGMASAIMFLAGAFFMIQSILIAGKLGMKGGDVAVKFAGGMTFGLAARAGRATIGKYAHDMSEREDLKDRASQGGLRGWAARQQLRTSRTVGDSSFDARNTGMGVGKALHAGEGRKGGYTSVKKEVQEKEEKFAKSLGEVSDDDVLVKARKGQMDVAKSELERNRDRLKKEMRDAPNEEARKTVQKELEQLEKNYRDAEEKHGQEKQRRVLGGTYEREKVESQLKLKKETMEEQKKEWARMTTQFNGASDAESKDFLKKEAEKARENYEKAKKEHDDLLDPAVLGGYTNVLKGSNWKNTWIKGRMVTHEREAGKAIEKAYSKKVKKTKEEKSHDELVEATKSKDK